MWHSSVSEDTGFKNRLLNEKPKTRAVIIPKGPRTRLDSIMMPEGLPPRAPSFYEENSVFFHDKDRESYRRTAAREGTWGSLFKIIFLTSQGHCE